MYKNLLIVLFTVCCSASQAQQQAFCLTENRAIKAGEKLNFRVYYNWSAVWVAAGEANFTTTLATLNGKPTYHIVGDGKTYKSYDWFFKVRDRYETYMSTETLLPQRFIRKVQEGSTKFSNFVNFDQENRKAYSDNKTFDVPECVQDVLSAIYYARNIDYSKYRPGATIPFSMFLDNEVYHLYIRYVGKVRITTRYGTFNAIKITPLLIEGTIFKGGEDMVVYVSDDANHIPLRVDSPIIVGSIKVDMMGYSGLRYPLTALIKKK
jgi:hypothetical protein